MASVKHVKIIEYNDGTKKVVIKGSPDISPKKLQALKEERKRECARLLARVEELRAMLKNGVDTRSMSFLREDFEEELQALEQQYIWLKSPKLENAQRALKRSRDELFDILHENDFNYFLTLTFDGRKVDRLNDVETRKKFSQWANNVRKRLPRDEVRRRF